LNVSSIIQGYYQSILSRTGTDAEVAGWASLVGSGAVPLAQVQAAFINSYEAATTVAPIVEMYQAALGRVPDQAGLTYWVSVLNSGSMTLAQIGLAFAGSAESQAYYGTTYDAGFVTSLYEKILGREPESGVVNFWLTQKAGGMTQAQMIETFQDSAEAKARAAPAVINFLTSAGQGNPNAYAGSLYAAGSIFTLTTGADAGIGFTGTTGNDTFNAIEDTSGLSPIPTWTTADAIDGGAGTNTFNVTQTAAIAGTPLSATVTNIQIANIVDAATVTLDTTGWAGLTALNVTDVGTTALTAAGGTGVTVTDAAGAVSVAGGSTQTVSTSAGDVAVLGGTGAIAVTDTAIGTHVISVDGGSSVAVTVSGETAGGAAINVGLTTAPTGAVTIIASSDPTATTTGSMGAISVIGGTVVNVTENVLGAVAQGTTTAGVVTITGTAVTTSVSVTQTAAATAGPGITGVNDRSVSVTDVNSASTTAAGTITSVSARNYTTLTVNDNALTTLSVAGGSGNVTINNGNLDTPTNTTLNATVDGLTGGSLMDSGVYTALNITTANTNSRLANISQAAVTALTVAGTKSLALTSTAGLAALTTVTVSGAAGLTADLSIPGTVTLIDTSGTTGTSAITMNGGTTTFSGGAGADIVTLTTASTKAIALGDGDDTLTIGALVPTVTISGGLGTDTLSMDSTSAATASSNGTFAALVTGFEKLVLTGATNQTINLSNLGIANSVQTHGGNGLTLSNLTSGGTLTLDGAGTAYTVNNSPSTMAADETLNLVLSADASAAGTNFAATGITAANMQTLAIASVNTASTPAGAHDHAVTLLGNVATTITIAGNNGLTLTATDTAATTIDASGITLGGFTWSAGALTAPASITGTTTGTNTVNFSAATGIVTYTGGSGNDNVVANNNNANVINLGNGTNNMVSSGGGNETITGGSGSDIIIVVGSGNNTISTGDGADFVATGGGANIITTGAGAKTLTLGSGSNIVTLGTHDAGTADSLSVAATGTGSFVPTAAITGLNTAGLDTITFAGDSSANSFTAFTAADMINFGDALGNNVVAGSAPPTLAAAVADVLGTVVLGGHLAQHAVGAFQYGGDTYVVEQAGATGSAFAAGDTLIKLTGTPTFNTSISAGVLHLLNAPI
jgi:S-layer protein